MLIIREVFSARPGQAGKMARLLRKAMGSEANVRIMTDLVGNYNTVVMEMQADSLAQWDERYKQRASNPPPDPQTAEEMKSFNDMWLSGRREVFQVVE